MKPSEMIPLLQDAWKYNEQLLIIGEPGIGKSDVIDQAARGKGYRVLTKHPAVEDPTDAKGMPAKVTLPDGTDIARFLPFEDLHDMITTKDKLIVHLEDFGQGSNAVQKAYMQLLLRRSVGAHKISPNVVFVGSTNEQGQMAGVEGVLEPVKGRWTLLRLTVSLQDWIVWACDNSMPPWLIAFMDQHPDMLHAFKPTKALTNSPCPRNWASVGRWDNMGRDSVELWTGRVGQGAAAEAYTYKQGAMNMPDPAACIANPHSAPLATTPSMNYAVAVALAYRLDGSNFNAVSTYLLRAGKPYEVLAIQAGWRRNPEISKTAGMIRWLAKPENRDISFSV